MADFYSNSTNNDVIPIIRVAEVKSVSDVSESGRIKVRITGIDDNIKNDSNLPNCTPLIPKYLTSLPKVGECVLVFQYEYSPSSPTAAFKSTRFWIGPIITQPDKLNEEPYNSALSLLPEGYTKLKNPRYEDGTYGNEDDIVLQGRYNTDIIQKDREIWIRAGKTQEDNPKKFNKNLGYIQLKYGNEKLKRVVKEKVIQTKVIPIPNRLITVNIRTIKNNNDVLTGDLSRNEYTSSDINRTELFINVKNIDSGEDIISFESENDFLGSTSREQAFAAAKSFIDINKGAKWKIKSLGNSAIDFVRDVYKGTNGIAVFSTTPIPGPPKVIKEIQLEKNDSKDGSVINVVANKINLLSNVKGANNFKLTNPKSLIDDKEQEKINNQAHPIVYGDVLVEFLELVKKYVSLHVHPYHGIPADPSTVTTNVLGFDLNKILNENINTN